MTQPGNRSAPTLQPGDRFVHTDPLDPLVAPLLEDLEREYDGRYGTMFGEPAAAEISRYPAEAFTAPGGTFALLLRGGAAISGGAFMTIDESTVEVKRMWTHVDHRGQGLARLVLAELEAEARRRGFRTVVLSTGPRQPEAVRLYLATGYTPLFDPALSAEAIVIHSFTKDLEGAA
ncbi:GNAT family N-acetyltransferase [Lacisediminihabitans profunda]|uniref:GNAT family N-acetyltransferase n=1 Tax=Lacisediminihabitans profunda TaxID=2594790 RepID=UPI001FE6574C|nr:GNAT family N-acetyltransferase [Lacisediminihabitans profunda]